MMSEITIKDGVNHTWIDHIPAIWVEPAISAAPRRLVIWLTGLSGSKEGVIPNLHDLAGRGFLALSFDPWQHGERGTESGEQIIQRVFGNFRRHMWPILAHTTEDTLRVIDWAIATLGVTPVIEMGGISMGGDISVAAAGLDQRIARVAAGIATADWLRPGSNTLPGEPDAYALLMYQRLNPLTHLQSYAHCPAITFECGAQDDHVPPDGALRFRDALAATYAACPERLRVNLHPGVGHAFTDTMWANCLDWLDNRDIVILKANTAPDMDSFDALIQKAREQAKLADLKRAGIASAISKARDRK
jgi:dienelactone hydrolase